MILSIFGTQHKKYMYLKSFTNEQMSDPGFKMGIFLYTKDNNLVNHYVYLEDIQLTRCYRDGNNDIITLGNIPTAVSLEAHHYYLKPDPQRTKKEITTYGSLEFLAKEFNMKREENNDYGQDPVYWRQWFCTGICR